VALDREVIQVGRPVRAFVDDAPEGAAVVPALGDELAAGFELRLIAVDDLLEPSKFLRDEPALGIEEGTRPGAADSFPLGGA
jgi:hypothetical protein